MKFKYLLIIFVIFLFTVNVFAITSNDMLARIKKLETGLTSFEADLKPQGNKNKLSKFGAKLDLLTDVKDGKVQYKKGNRIKIQGKLKGIKVSAIENDYIIKFNVGPFKGKMDVEDEPGRRYSSVDLCFLSSWLWENNKVTVLSTDENGICKCKFDPIQGGNEKRHDLIWIDSKTLKLIKREKYNTDGIFKMRIVYSDWKEMIPGYWVAVKYTTYNQNEEMLGINHLINLKINTGINDNIFSVK